MTAVKRPDPPENRWASEGLEYVAAPHAGWRLATGRRCRWIMPGRHACGQPSVAELNRGYTRSRSGVRRENWWAYCAEHLYGNWIEDGQVMQWVLRKTGGES